MQHFFALSRCYVLIVLVIFLYFGDADIRTSVVNTIGDFSHQIFQKESRPTWKATWSSFRQPWYDNRKKLIATFLLVLLICPGPFWFVMLVAVQWPPRTSCFVSFFFASLFSCPVVHVFNFQLQTLSGPLLAWIPRIQVDRLYFPK